MNERHIVVVGGGAAGFFAAITCAETSPAARVTLLERGPQFLAKVRISGGGRCNVTHACFDPKELSGYYPRGGAALLGPFQVFQPADTVAWFEARGVRLKTEADGRMFPTSDSSQTVIDCLLRAATSTGVRAIANQGVEAVTRRQTGDFDLALTGGARLLCDRLMLATGGCRGAAAGRIATMLGHTLQPPVPSLFTFHLPLDWLRAIAGVSVELVEVAIPDLRLRERGAMLITHQGLSGPVILRLSAWGARPLHQLNYQFPIRINWVPQLAPETFADRFRSLRTNQPARRLINAPFPPLAARLWQSLVITSGITPETRCAELSRSAQHRLTQQLIGTELEVRGKSLNQDEFVTCGGVRLDEVNFKSMASRLCPGLYFGGELLDIDGLTGGFNFQAAWTTGWIAGRAMGSLTG